MGSNYEADRRKMQREMFEFHQQLSAMEAKNADLVEADRNKVAILKDVENQHRSEIEKLSKQHQLSLKKQVCYTSETIYRT